jgi:hypothetical protein
VALRTDRLHEADEGLLRSLTENFPHADVSVVELGASPGASPGAVRTALASGARHAIRIIDGTLTSTDPHAAAQAWRAALARVGAPLTLVAQAADPEGAGVSSAPLARALGVPHVAQVEALGPDALVPGRLRARVRSGGKVFALPLDGAALLATAFDWRGTEGASASPDATPAPHRLEILTLGELGIPSALIRRSHDLAGQLRPFARSFVRCDDLGSLTAALRGSQR